ncbi:hypothetical protein [Paenibacillus mucilaginosus]|uniref:Uncharacterized protein n=3 Tax=Paenibacillus mucilaginosus TaxID=61624 RepID=H6NN80_9BACL|nr:hypothetical protein [Paenibacillus mucilaginosus]AEI44206.1 hypothetical protein KNP414_05682 [Paenibacillus mucilaginosus KNP414]AFC31756.1 hypothetical protein PM3016_5026 [Paenibacillus mucilaginosus 3016]AFH64109.1 hypothetical protein B2K_26055 [Paenibacillus mucilaginosus K02]MCG7216620.1 hypothetical protein [Paenibacillus mucilaginosus]WDM25619.1 hypothetical protein KCX80_24630 [Paenibacillus mucilaginosus]
MGTLIVVTGLALLLAIWYELKGIQFKLKQRLRHDERIIERLDLLLNGLAEEKKRKEREGGGEG